MELVILRGSDLISSLMRKSEDFGSFRGPRHLEVGETRDSHLEKGMTTQADLSAVCFDPRLH